MWKAAALDCIHPSARPFWFAELCPATQPGSAARLRLCTFTYQSLLAREVSRNGMHDECGFAVDPLAFRIRIGTVLGDHHVRIGMDVDELPVDAERGHRIH